MKLHISTNNSHIYVDDINHFHNLPYLSCFTEYKMNYDQIPLFMLNSEINDSEKTYDDLILMPSTHINNLWHLLHQIFLLYKYIKIKNIDTKNLYPIFFNTFYERQGDITQGNYNKIIFKGLGFDEKIFKELFEVFKKNEFITINNLFYCNEKLNYNNYFLPPNPTQGIFFPKQFQIVENEPLFSQFKQDIIQNFGLIKEKKQNKQVTFILRRNTRIIDNIEEIQLQLSNLNIQYIYFEDHSLEKQLEIVYNTDILIGVHGAGLAWFVFMEDRSKLIEIYPGNSITDNYVRWSKIANVEYINLKGDITNFKSDDKFRDANVKLNQDTINKIKLICI